jgi:hypothetical protein
MPLERNPYYRRCCQEHRELERLLHEANELFRGCRAGTDPSCWRQAAVMLTNLGDYLRQHFAHEEEGGYLEEAIAHLPRLGPRADELMQQHGPLLCRLAKLEQRLHAARSAEAWQALTKEFSGLAEALAAHEEAENAIMDEAFCNEQIEA